MIVATVVISPLAVLPWIGAFIRRNRKRRSIAFRHDKAQTVLGIVVIIRKGFTHFFAEVFHLLRNLGDYAACLCAIKFE